MKTIITILLGTAIAVGIWFMKGPDCETKTGVSFICGLGVLGYIFYVDWNKVRRSIFRKQFIVVIVVLLSIMTGCSSKSGQRMEERNANKYMNVRATVLENNTITFCRLNVPQQEVLLSGDTVWLNLATHMIDDTSDSTMKAVLTSNKMNQNANLK